MSTRITQGAPSTQTTQSTARSYYFDPLAQTYSESYDLTKRGQIEVTLTKPDEVPSEELGKVIQQLGNRMALFVVQKWSEDTAHNYCNNYTEHPGCDQRPWRYCKRHLTEQELKECHEMETILASQWIPLNEAHGFYMQRGDIDLARRIISCVRNTIQADKYKKHADDLAQGLSILHSAGLLHEAKGCDEASKVQRASKAKPATV